MLQLLLIKLSKPARCDVVEIREVLNQVRFALDWNHGWIWSSAPFFVIDYIYITWLVIKQNKLKLTFCTPYQGGMSPYWVFHRPTTFDKLGSVTNPIGVSHGSRPRLSTWLPSVTNKWDDLESLPFPAYETNPLLKCFLFNPVSSEILRSSEGLFGK